MDAHSECLWPALIKRVHARVWPGADWLHLSPSDPGSKVRIKVTQVYLGDNPRRCLEGKPKHWLSSKERQASTRVSCCEPLGLGPAGDFPVATWWVRRVVSYHHYCSFWGWWLLSNMSSPTQAPMATVFAGGVVGLWTWAPGKCGINSVCCNCCDRFSKENSAFSRYLRWHWSLMAQWAGLAVLLRFSPKQRRQVLTSIGHWTGLRGKGLPATEVDPQGTDSWGWQAPPGRSNQMAGLPSIFALFASRFLAGRLFRPCATPPRTFFGREAFRCWHGSESAGSWPSTPAGPPDPSSRHTPCGPTS